MLFASLFIFYFFFFSSRRRHTRSLRDWSSDVCSSDLSEDAALLDLLVEAAQGALERLVLSHSDFSQSVFTSSDPGLAYVHPARGRPARTQALRSRSQSRRSLPEGCGVVKRSGRGLRARSASTDPPRRSPPRPR